MDTTLEMNAHRRARSLKTRSALYGGAIAIALIWVALPSLPLTPAPRYFIFETTNFDAMMAKELGAAQTDSAKLGVLSRNLRRLSATDQVRYRDYFAIQAALRKRVRSSHLVKLVLSLPFVGVMFYGYRANKRRMR